MTFIQIIECRTDDLTDFMALEDEWSDLTEGRRTVRRTVVTRDRNDPTRHLLVMFYDSYESAMANSGLPETGDYSARQAAILAGPMAFHDLDVVDERIYGS